MNSRRLLPAALLSMLAAATTHAAVIATAPTVSQTVSAGSLDFSADLLLTPDAAASMVGYDVAFKITGPTAGLTITGVESGSSHPATEVFASDPAFSTPSSAGNTLYAFSDFLISGTGAITGNSILFRLKFHAAPGTTGAFTIDFVTDPASPFKSILYANAGLTPVPTTFQSGTITFAPAAPIPEPATLSLLAASSLLMLRRRSR